MRGELRLWLCAVLALTCGPALTHAQVRDGGIDPWNLGKGDWIYFMSDATNKLGGNVAGVTNENSLMLFYKSQGIRYIIVKAATSDVLFNGSYNRPQFTSNLCNIARTNGILIFGYNRSYGSNVVGEIAISDYVFRQGADGFVWDAEAEWESDNSWIGLNGPAKAWQLCSTVRSNWPTKFLAHAPFPIISFHTSFPYKEFGFWSDTVMPQIYHFGWTGVKRSPSGGINWSDVNWHTWQNDLFALPPTNINGLTVYWTNAIKPLAPINHVYGPDAPPAASPIPDKDVMEFIDYLAADPNPPTPGGYKGVSFWRADLHGPVQWDYIRTGTSGSFNGAVNNIVIDNPNAVAAGGWTSVRTFYNGSFYAGVSDTNSFGTNYLFKTRGTGAAYVQFTPNISSPGAYKVYQWHPRRADASGAVPFLITFNGGTTNVNANQQTNSGNWSLLGQFDFAAGTNGNVRVMDTFPEPTAVAMADGVKFVFVSGFAPPSAPSGLSASAVSTSRVDLAWADNSTNETGFVLARSPSSGGPYTDLITLPPNATNYSDLGLAPASPYYYVVRATTLSGDSTNSNEAMAVTLALPVPPAITNQPKNRTALLGEPVSFSVGVSGTAPLSFQWRFNASPIPGATGSTYLIASPAFANAGRYSVLVTNAFGTMLSSNAVLSIVTVGAWGENTWGQGVVPSEATNFVGIAAGSWHNLGLRLDGSILAWGYNWQGQCDVPPTLGPAVALAAGGFHSLAIKPDGSAGAWGANDYAQVTVPAAASNLVAIAAGKWHSLALRADGAVVAWGDNTFGQTALPAGLPKAVAIAAAGNHSLALLSDGRVAGWGENFDSGGLFVGQSIVPWGLSNVVAVAAGAWHSLALKADGTVTAWGDNSHGQCNVPPGLAGVVALGCGSLQSLALRADGTVVGWGSGFPTQVPAGVSNFIGIAAGEAHTLLLQQSALPEPRLFRPARQGGQFSAVIQTLNRRSYGLDFKGSLQETGWNGLPAVPGNGALRLLADPQAIVGQRFYRLRQW